MALKSQACTLSSRLCPLCCRLMGRAEARPAPCFFLLQVCREPLASQGLKGTGSPQEPQAPGQPHTSDQATGRPLGQPLPSALRPWLCTWHAPRAPRPSGFPSPLAGWPGSVCSQAWRQRCRSPWWPPPWLAGRAQLGACVLACPGPAQGAPGWNNKGEFGATGVSSHPGAELTAAPWRSPPGNLKRSATSTPHSSPFRPTP